MRGWKYSIFAFALFLASATAWEAEASSRARRLRAAILCGAQIVNPEQIVTHVTRSEAFQNLATLNRVNFSGRVRAVIVQSRDRRGATSMRMAYGPYTIGPVHYLAMERLFTELTPGDVPIRAWQGELEFSEGVLTRALMIAGEIDNRRIYNDEDLFETFMAHRDCPYRRARNFVLLQTGSSSGRTVFHLDSEINMQSCRHRYFYLEQAQSDLYSVGNYLASIRSAFEEDRNGAYEQMAGLNNQGGMLAGIKLYAEKVLQEGYPLRCGNDAFTRAIGLLRTPHKMRRDDLESFEACMRELGAVARMSMPVPANVDLLQSLIYVTTDLM